MPATDTHTGHATLACVAAALEKEHRPSLPCTNAKKLAAKTDIPRWAKGVLNSLQQSEYSPFVADLASNAMRIARQAGCRTVTDLHVEQYCREQGILLDGVHHDGEAVDDDNDGDLVEDIDASLAEL